MSKDAQLRMVFACVKYFFLITRYLFVNSLTNDKKKMFKKEIEVFLERILCKRFHQKKSNYFVYIINNVLYIYI